jgi:hypothetical protein
VPRIVGLLSLAFLACGCQPSGPLEGAGVSLSVPDSWKPVEPTRWNVPGRPLGAWAGPEGSSLVAYQTLPVPGGGAAVRVAEGLVNRLTNLPELRILGRREETIAGAPAVRIDLLAPGFGDALAPSGVGVPMPIEGKQVIPTRQATVVFARHAGSLFLTWSAPESAWSRIAPEIDATLGKLALSADSPRSSSSY